MTKQEFEQACRDDMKQQIKTVLWRVFGVNKDTDVFQLAWVSVRDHSVWDRCADALIDDTTLVEASRQGAISERAAIARAETAEREGDELRSAVRVFVANTVQLPVSVVPEGVAR